MHLYNIVIFIHDIPVYTLLPICEIVHLVK